MACLQHPERDHPVYLMAHHTVGRRQGAVDTRIPSAEISGIHAAIQWTGTHWNIRDLSRNGTWLNGQQLVPARNYELQQGDKISFGRASNPAWSVINLDEPENLLIDLATGDAVTLEQYHLLPDEREPLASLHFNPVNGHWLYELTGNSNAGDGAAVVSHGERIDCGLHSWQLFLPDNQGATKELSLQQMTICEFTLRFSVSHHEEHVQLQLCRADLQVALPARIHHYLLLYLARARMVDIERGIDPDAQGWVSIQVATRELGITVNHLNTQIFRARKQIAESLPDAIDTSGLVERRSWEIRLGCRNFEIFKGSRRESRTGNIAETV
ncbi:FHA domain-containing protein [Microbulbifer yueqingensis]|uniref:FHA domain-containing protein n=1 Tax=Microbulbifer yueqingensis TaxID=658219 RepID=A0A1G8XYV7_9GAMM|nr:FHA domain-containing protein [Microbulbifer yueqingensis]SDJ94950.1 FHA domain-containing protein [Microbulbifer yueqingensis]